MKGYWIFRELMGALKKIWIRSCTYNISKETSIFPSCTRGSHTNCVHSINVSFDYCLTSQNRSMLHLKEECEVQNVLSFNVEKIESRQFIVLSRFQFMNNCNFVHAFFKLNLWVFCLRYTMTDLPCQCWWSSRSDSVIPREPVSQNVWTNCHNRLRSNAWVSKNCVWNS